MAPDEFLRFVRAKPPEGLDATPEEVRLFLKDSQLLDLWDQLTVNGRGSNGASNNPNGRAGKPEKETNTDNIIVSSEVEHGTSRQYAIRRLRNGAPAIHAKVMSGELTAHAGMVEAGDAKSRENHRKSLIAMDMNAVPRV